MILSIVILILVIFLILAGFAGIFLPGLPGAPLMFLGMLLWGIFTNFEKIGFFTYLILGILTLIISLADYFSGTLGAKKYGASVFGILGAALFGIAGLIYFSIVGFIVGMFLGAILGELLGGKNFKKSFKIGGGVILGFLGGVIFKTIAALIMIGVFMGAVIF
jgi:uncharacterized protein YqgC (DUF456 family)